MKILKYFIIILPLVFLFSSGCSRTTSGLAVGGAIAGAAVGATLGHHSGSQAVGGALIGGTMGAITGTAIAQSDMSAKQRQKTAVVICPTCESHVDVSEFPAHSTVECPKCYSHFTY